MESSLSISTNNGDHHHHHHKLDNLVWHDIFHFYLFKYLHLADILMLRLVSKSFYKIVKGFNIKELTFIDNDSDFDFYKSLLTPSKFLNLVDYSKLGLLINPADYLLKLKDLAIFGFISTYIKLSDLNKFTKLQKLRIDGWYLSSKENDLLQLIELQQLCIEFYYDHSYFDRDQTQQEPGRLLIDTPNLRALEIIYEIEHYKLDNLIKIQHPHTVEWLKIDRFHDDLSRFRNLENLLLYTWNSNHLEMMTNEILKLKKLKKLKINYLPSYSEQTTINRLKNLFRIKQDALKIVLKGVQINEIDKLNEYDGKDDGLRFQLNNYGDLEDDLEFVTRVDYEELVLLLPANQPNDLFKKFNNVQRIEIKSKIKDENRLIQFVKGCKNLQELVVINSSLSQRFYDQLPTISLLIGLEIGDNDVDLDFEFVMKMPHLWYLEIDQDVVFDKINLNNLKYLKWFHFKINDRYIMITKLDTDKYEAFDTDKKYLTFNEVTEWINRFRQLSNHPN